MSGVEISNDWSRRRSRSLSSRGSGPLLPLLPPLDPRYVKPRSRSQSHRSAWLVLCFSWLRTVIRFLWVSAKCGICAVVSVNGTLVEDKKCVDSRVNVHILA